MSVAMLTLAAQQGVDTVVATPHFYWSKDETPASFLRDRQAAYDRLLPHLGEGLPQIKLGAEVLMREHISRLDLRPLCMEDTDILLVEMPFSRPCHWLFAELEEIAYTQRLTLMLAHLDRYMPWFKRQDLEQLLELPDVIVQLNAETIVDRRSFRALRKWLPDCPRLVLGSDMHNLGDRAPETDKAIRVLSGNRTGRLWMEQIDSTAAAIGDPDALSDKLEGWI